MSESLTPESEAPSEQQNGKQEQSQTDRETVKRLLSEARNTRDVITDFKSAIESGSFQGSKMMALAKGISFLEAILMQNQAHIANLQGRN